MRAVSQRARHAAVRVAGRTIGEIEEGLVVFLAVGPDDDQATAAHLARRIATLRVFRDENGRMNLDVGQAGGQVLVVSQFTLFADSSRGHRPSFLNAASPAHAASLCAAFCSALRDLGHAVESGEFGAEMEVEVLNDGPVTLVLSSGEGPWSADAG